MELSELRKIIQGIKNQTIMDYQMPNPVGLRKNLIYAFAEAISKNYREERKQKNYSIDLFKFVYDIKGVIHCVDTEDYLTSGSIYVHAKEKFDIVIPKFTSPIRDRFTIAHEIGHYYLHSFAGDKKIWADRKGSGPAECEANWFAASFLMPKYLIDKFDEPSSAKIMNAFGVSQEAAEFRLKYYINQH